MQRITKQQRLRDYFQQKPNASTDEALAALSSYGIVRKNIHNFRYANKPKRRTAIPVLNNGKPVSANSPDLVALTDLISVQKVVKNMGFEAARRAIDALEILEAQRAEA